MRRCLLVLLTLFLAGCGGNAPSGETSEDVPVQTTHIVGRAVLDRPFAGATITFFTPEGIPIETAGPVVADGVGFFQADLPGQVTDFRAVASANGESYASDYEGFAPSGLVVISPLTSIVAAHQDAHPTLTLAESEDAVRRYLELPPEQDLHFHMVLNAHRDGFNVARFLQQARANGLDAFVARIVVSVDSVDGVTPPPIPNAIFQNNQTQFWTNQGIQLGVAVVSTVLQVAGIPAGALIGWAVNLILDETEGSPEQRDFQALAQEIEALGTEIEEVYQALSQEIKEQTYTNSLNDQIAEISLIQTVREQLQDYLQNGTTASKQSALVSTMTGSDFLNLLTDIHNAQMGIGSSGLIRQLASVVSLSELPFYSNSSQFNPLASEFNYFAGQQTTAVHLIAEGFHALPTPDPASARFWYDIYCKDVAIQASDLPQPLDSDEVVVHRTSGLIFYYQAMDKATRDDARSFAAHFRTGRFVNWRVATSQDVEALLGAHDHQTFRPDQLEAAGFDLTNAKKDNTSLGLGDNVFSTINDGPDTVAFNQLTSKLDPDFQWNHRHHSYLMVCDAENQPTDMWVTFGELTAIAVQPAPGENSMQALGTYRIGVLHDGKVSTRETSGLDITNLVYWESSDAKTLRIQNVPSRNSNFIALPTTPKIKFGPGAYSWLQSGSVTVTAYAFSPFQASNPQVNGQFPLTNDNVPPPTLNAVLVGPHKIEISQAPSLTNISVNGFYSDGSSQLLSSGVTWTTSAPEASVLLVNGQYQLQLTGKPAASTLVVTATVDGKSDSVTYTLVIP